ncbi:MAG: MBL fold metallo-hydrolase [Pseudomonadales bacterium]|jgi:glyoxylase-like metal-dependent hydrolase (beta-lactamase superfamily II)|nr:MBL fold metallo-hydrolase [Pseudomonadales bacterium]MCP5332972.1 MBL fold metallo-hydrolase [Pseudomonadales bacterium]HMU91052.1 MBL fold metallo-hydrolase [Pseudomonadales bacterium]HMW15891.1 MBL fold metallo-hydrolase [Pseudomonadales bacterium]HMZ71736.1 MBL fold metallo-hydrolase [Pseudomonadales bacterium]
MKYAVIPVTPFQQNCTLFICEKSSKAVVIDPGGEVDRILQLVAQQGATVEKILVTHGHLDHASGVADLAERLGVPIEGPHEADRFWIEQIPKQGEMFGFKGRSFEPDRWLADGDRVRFGEVTLEVLHCPGHTPGHVVFFAPEARLAQVGDVLFAGSIGRTDFPLGDHQTLIDSITHKLWPLGDDVTFIPGHGPESTFGYERKTNPFVAD